MDLIIQCPQCNATQHILKKDINKKKNKICCDECQCSFDSEHYKSYHWNIHHKSIPIVKNIRHFLPPHFNLNLGSLDINNPKNTSPPTLSTNKTPAALLPLDLEISHWYTTIKVITSVSAMLVISSMLAFFMRNDVIGYFPALQPMFSKICYIFNCSLHWPQHTKNLQLYGLQMHPNHDNSSMIVSGTLNNNSSQRTACPYIHLTILDPYGQTIQITTLKSYDYLASHYRNNWSALDPHTQYTIQIQTPIPNIYTYTIQATLSYSS